MLLYYGFEIEGIGLESDPSLWSPIYAGSFGESILTKIGDSPPFFSPLEIGDSPPFVKPCARSTPGFFL